MAAIEKLEDLLREQAVVGPVKDVQFYGIAGAVLASYLYATLKYWLFPEKKYI